MSLLASDIISKKFAHDAIFLMDVRRPKGNLFSYIPPLSRLLWGAWFYPYGN